MILFPAASSIRLSRDPNRFLSVAVINHIASFPEPSNAVINVMISSNELIKAIKSYFLLCNIFDIIQKDSKKGVFIKMNAFTKRGWLSVVACAIATFNSGALFFGYPGIVTEYWTDLFNANSSETGWIMTFALLGVGTFTLVTGFIHNKKMGTRISFAIGTCFLLACMIFANFVSSVPQLYLWGFLNGAGTGFIYGPSLTTVQHWFPQRRGLATGVVNLVFGTAAAIMSPLYTYLLSSVGYEVMNYIAIAMIVVFNGIGIIFAELPDRIRLDDDQIKGREKIQEMVKAQAESKGPSLAAESKTVPQALRTWRFWAIWLCWVFSGAAGISMVSHGSGFAGSIGVASVVVITSFNLTNGIGRIVAGTISDLVGRNVTGCIAFVLGCIGYIGLPFCNNIVLIAIFSAFVGFNFGTLFAVSSPLVSDIFGLEHYSSIFSLVFTAYGFISGIVGPALIGMLITATGGYTIPFLILAAFCLASAILILTARPHKKTAK